jgi:putative oxidoreductase
VSTEDDRPRSAGGYSDSGLFTPGSSPYSSSGGTHGTDDPPGRYGDSGYTDAPTTVLPSTTAFDDLPEEETPERPRAGWHAGADLGLLILRLALGGLFIVHGLQHLFGWFQGPGISGTANLLGDMGYSNGTALAWLTGVSELAGGAFVLLGLFTPAGAAAILAVMANVIIVKIDGNLPFGGVELEAIYGSAALALLFTGPGRISLDRPTPWYRYAPAFGTVFLVIAAAATAVMLTVFR